MLFPDFNHILFFGWHVSGVTDDQIERVIPAAAGGLGYDVQVPRDYDRYDGRTIKRMVKLVNRRGRVRWICRGISWLSNQLEHHVFEKQQKIAGVDDLAAFIDAKMEEPGEHGLFVSFEDRFEARRFKRDLDALVVPDDVAAQIAEERARRERIAAKHRLDLPQHSTWAEWNRFRQSHVPEPKWRMMVKPAQLNAERFDQWLMARRSHFQTALWKPGKEPILIRGSLKRGAFAVADWQKVRARCEREQLHLLFFFQIEEYGEEFERTYGPGQFLVAPPPSLLPR